MITVLFQSQQSGPSKRYVAKGIDCYRWCEQSIETPWFDFAQGTCDREDLPEEIAAICDEKGLTAFYACEWPKV